MSNMTPYISIIVPCFNEKKHIRAFVDNLLSLEKPAGGFEVIIADGMSNDGTRDYLENIGNPDIRVIDNPGRYVSHGLNEAILAARGKLIIRMDVHSVYAGDYIVKCVETLERTKAENVGGPWLLDGKAYFSKAIAAAFLSPLATGGQNSHDPDYEGRVDTVHLGCWRKKVLIEHGMFDENFIRNQDDELNLRITKSGGVVWQNPEIRHWSSTREGIRKLFLQYYQYGYWKWEVMKKHRIIPSIRHIIPGLFVTGLIIAVIIQLMNIFIGSKILAAADMAFFVIFLFYLVLIISSSAVLALKNGLKYFPVFPVIFLCFHFGYGMGFISAVAADIFKKRPASASSESR